MCGLSGWWRTDQGSPLALAEVAAAMAQSLRHRGPDSGGIWADERHGIALSHRRLAILDLSPDGAQPMDSVPGRYAVVLNGEIYNYQALRRELTGQPIRGSSDTAVLLAAFEQWGVAAALPHCRGMFALAVWDRQEHSLTLARDRAGEKPLYYGWCGGNLAFASELRAFGAVPGWSGEIDRASLAEYFRWGYVPAPQTIYSGIHKMPPAHFCTFRGPNHEARPAAYWSFPKADASARNLTEPDCLAELHTLLKSAIAEQMVSDVPLGAFLSGGIDSSLVVAVMQELSCRPVRTFSIGFEEAGFNEAPQARAVAAHLGTEHEELCVSPAEARGIIPELSQIYDEPFADASQIPTCLLARLARSDVSVALSGDAGDELFGGYTRYQQGRRAWSALGVIPTPLTECFAYGLRHLKPRTWNRLGTVAGWSDLLLGDRLHKLAELIAAPGPANFYETLMSNWSGPSPVLGEETMVAGEERVAGDFVDFAMTWDFLQYLPDDILVKIDRAAMAVSLETRVPFLDPRVIAFARELPVSIKIRSGVGKWPLRQILHSYVPPGLVERPKMGFGVPMAAWLRGPLRSWAEDLLSPTLLQADGYLESEAVRLKWHEHLSGVRNWHRQLWAVLMWQSWRQRRDAACAAKAGAA